ncbi:ShlB/FhaC/HecB family hemolysin secretion/activation protein [Pseudomaricurvus alkylphenolicus]|jgi:hemolysin activation/secretion protein|uniref:ShlB/FhaC/HecB family hemolysin secretion/activation protein n=1 Tax=Pseudomaricurvus alkylphenolicus TaxID=1306991 RepID=UPI00141F480C|nr:ShlB/FhaC/HecB family hemolysin secretion/activation protein [Pseudomaricurvus alkylphenolicus]NIB42928.1 ShlB/FhaC/HecB family hemolysin secretion/activation protein [Pseudomaricurvus alkylphenolicus]
MNSAPFPLRKPVALAVSMVAAALLGASTISAQQVSPRVTIESYEVVGNNLLPRTQVQNLLAPFSGADRGFGDIQRAQDALRLAYREAGYTTVQVLVPEQEISAGIVQLQVFEGTVQKVVIEGNEYHDQANILGALPNLEQGKVPNARKLSENLELANQNPSRNLEVVFSLTDNANIQAKIDVKDKAPGRFVVTADNTGSDDTGEWRTGIGYRHDNLFNRDHSLALHFTTSPEHTDRVKQYSISYRLPLYGLGDSIDILLAKSEIDAGTSQTVFGPLNFSGEGNVYAMYYNHYFARRGEYSSQLTAGIDWRAYDNECDLDNVSCGAASADVTVHPLSLRYQGQWRSSNQTLRFDVGYLHNIAGGDNGDDEDFILVRPNDTDPSDGAQADYDVIRISGDWQRQLFGQWQLHLGAKLQYTDEPLVAGEQFGLAGVWAVRGFEEREESRDRGYVTTAELFSPDLSGVLGERVFEDGGIRALLFLDHARGERVLMSGESDRARVSLGSAGLGLRMELDNMLSIRLDVAQVLDEAGEQEAGDVNAHFGFHLSW